MLRRGFTLIEIVAAVAVVGVVAAAGVFGIVPLVERARRDEQTREALAQIRRLRARSLTVNAGGALEVTPRPAGGVHVVTAVVPRQGGLLPCQNFDGRASTIERRDYDLVDIVVPRADNTLCFEASAFRLLADDGASLADAPAPIDFFADDAATLGRLTVSPAGTFTSTFQPDVDEGLSA
ncbi:MAG TPA: prepilin-type N-terminal cleavage/methylation domain-containing protein, partial [Myxococcota bacterium]